jgi:DNA-directed RNA polymerase specialized sigma24 family protein
MQPFEAIVAEHGQVVMRVCRGLLGPVEAEDAWSETFLAALRAYPSLRAGSNVRGWLVTIAHNKAVDQIRARLRVPVPVGGEIGEVSEVREGFAGVSAGSERQAADAGPGGSGLGGGGPGGSGPGDTELHRALAGLPPKQRGAVVYRYLADLPYSEVAALLDCSQAAARRNAADGIARLRRHYGKERS